MPDDYYNLLDIKAFQETNSKPEDYERLFKQGGIGVQNGNPACDPFASCAGSDVVKKKSASAECPSRNIQTCIQKTTIKVGGNLQDSTVQNNQMMNCVQNVTNTAPTPSSVPGPSPPASLPTAVSTGSPTPAPTPAPKPAPAPKPKPKAAPVPKPKPKPKPKPEPEKSNTGLYLIIVLIILVLLGGGGFLLMKKK
jgi:hypothetical protein